MWVDGICKKCGSIVLETVCGDEDDKLTNFSDYKNKCSNTKCIEYKWHYVGDMEELDYYYHNPRLVDDERFKKLLQEILKGNE